MDYLQPMAKRRKIEETAAGFILYNKFTNEVVIVKQTKNQLWSFPKGKTEEGDENLFSTAVREVEEETGLQKYNFKYNKYIYKDDVFPVIRTGKIKYVRYFIGLLNKTHDLLSLNNFSEIETILSVNLDDIYNYLPKDKYEKFINYLKTHRQFPKVVKQYDLNGNFINEFYSAKVAAIVTDINVQCIIQICQGNKYQKRGFRFEYA